MGFFFTMRVSAFIDGFNLYHAIDDLQQHHWKWLNLKALCTIFSPQPDFTLSEIYYFSAYATWRPEEYKRHRDYVKALKSSGVTPIMGNFKFKDRQCHECNHTWTDPEEKETDVNIALCIAIGAFRNSYDRALLISGDSDLSPGVRLIKREFPDKDLRIIAPVGRGYSMDLYRATGGSKHCRKMK